jgi:hypothetical protein
MLWIVSQSLKPVHRSVVEMRDRMVIENVELSHCMACVHGGSDCDDAEDK